MSSECPGLDPVTPALPRVYLQQKKKRKKNPSLKFNLFFLPRTSEHGGTRTSSTMQQLRRRTFRAFLKRTAFYFVFFYGDCPVKAEKRSVKTSYRRLKRRLNKTMDQQGQNGVCEKLDGNGLMFPFVAGVKCFARNLEPLIIRAVV